MEDEGREYQQSLVTAISAEIGARGWSRNELARRSGISQQQVQRIMSLKRDMTVAQLGAIIRAIGVTPGYLVEEAERRRDMIAPDMSVVDEVLAADTTLTPRQKASLREQAQQGDTPSGHGHRERSHRKVL